MSRVISSLILAVGLFLAYISQPVLAADGGVAKPREGWSAAAPRDEVRSGFSYRPDGGPERQERWSPSPTTARGCSDVGRKPIRSPAASPIASPRFAAPRTSSARDGAGSCA